MDHTNFPMATAIHWETLQTFQDKVDWDEVYGRWGTETLVYPDDYGGMGIPEHLIGKVTHVWLYWEK